MKGRRKHPGPPRKPARNRAQSPGRKVARLGQVAKMVNLGLKEQERRNRGRSLWRWFVRLLGFGR